MLMTPIRRAIFQVLEQRFGGGKQFDAEAVYKALLGSNGTCSLSTVRLTLLAFEAEGWLHRDNHVRARTLFSFASLFGQHNTGRRRVRRASLRHISRS